MPKITLDVQRITMRIPKSVTGLDRQVTFVGIDWNEQERFLEIKFKCDYIKIKVIKVYNDVGILVDKEVIEVINDPRLGLVSYEQKFKADDRTYVNTNGTIVKFPNQEAMVNLETIHWLTQYEFYYKVSREYGFHMNMFQTFINQITESGGWDDFKL